MSTDLTTVKDHPATLLREHYAPQQVAIGNIDDADGLVIAGRVLNDYERVNNVTFAALDNDALAAVREAYTEVEGLPFGAQRHQALDDLAAAVRDLLGLADD